LLGVSQNTSPYLLVDLVLLSGGVGSEYTKEVFWPY
jgi:hypothetical protein